MKRAEPSPKIQKMDKKLEQLDAVGSEHGERLAEELAFRTAYESLRNDLENSQVYLEKTRHFAAPLEDRIQEIYRMEGEERARSFARNCTGPKTGDEIFKMAIANLEHNKHKLRGF